MNVFFADSVPGTFAGSSPGAALARDVEAWQRASLAYTPEDAFRPRFNLEQWRSVSAYMTLVELRAGQALFAQGDLDRSFYLVLEGTLQGFAKPVPGQAVPKVVMWRSGQVLGEAGLFSATPRMASVEAMSSSRLLALKSARLDELVQRAPALAAEWLKAAGCVLATRMRWALTQNQICV